MAQPRIVYTVARVNASQRFTPEEKERVILRLAEELQAEVDKFKYDTSANLEYVNAVRERVGRELVWLDVHKDPNVFTRETRLSPNPDPVSRLWNHVTRQFRAWERAPQPPKHFQGMLPAEFTPEQLVLDISSFPTIIGQQIQGAVLPSRRRAEHKGTQVRHCLNR